MEKTKLNLQEYLSLGYIYLIILGIVSNVIFYKFIGINILNYSTISDILMGPVKTLMHNPAIMLMCIVLVIFAYFSQMNLLPYLKQVLGKNDKETDDNNPALPKPAPNRPFGIVLVSLALFFIGLKTGAGASLKKRIEAGTLTISHQITFSDNTTKNVKVIDQNSTYLFYVVDHEKKISIMPIGGNIKEIKTK